MEVFNEIVLLLLLYTYLCFSDWLRDADLQLSIGYVSCALIAIHFVLNLYLIIAETVRTTKRKCRIHSLRKKHEKDREALKIRLKETQS